MILNNDSYDTLTRIRNSEVLSEVLGEVFDKHLTLLKPFADGCFRAIEWGDEVFLLTALFSNAN